MTTITVQYQCPDCCPGEWRDVEVRCRAESEDILEWAEYASHRVMLVHADESPQCQSTNMSCQLEPQAAKSRIN